MKKVLLKCRSCARDFKLTGNRHIALIRVEGNEVEVAGIYWHAARTNHDDHQSALRLKICFDMAAFTAVKHDALKD